MAESELLGLWASLIKLTIEDSADGLLSKETEQKIVKVCHLSVLLECSVLVCIVECCSSSFHVCYVYIVTNCP